MILILWYILKNKTKQIYLIMFLKLFQKSILIQIKTLTQYTLAQF